MTSTTTSTATAAAAAAAATTTTTTTTTTATTEGYHYEPATGLVAGLHTAAVVTPPTSPGLASLPADYVFDLIVLGAGYAGLTAARDAAISGLKVLLIEARDRIGGRTWSADVDGYLCDMGGTWVHWNQPHVYREISRYGFQDQLKPSSPGDNPAPGTEREGRETAYSFETLIGRDRGTMTREQEDAVLAKVLATVCNVDGQHGRLVLPYPHNPHYSPLAHKYEKMSARERIAEVRDQLSDFECALLESFVLHISGGTLETAGLFDLLRWFALCDYSGSRIVEYGITYKFAHGQTSFARRFFREALDSGNCSYAFRSPAASVVQGADDCVTVTVADNGGRFRARRVACTVPLNVLADISFTPPLGMLKTAAARLGHIDTASKVHAEVANRELRSWTGMTYPDNSLLYGYGDGTAPGSGDTYIVCFGAAHNQLHPEDDVDRTLAAVRLLHGGEMGIKRLVFHNWARDPYAKGAWCIFRPDFSFKYLAALQQRHGNVLFASADWADGWRGFIDGAIEQGTRCALAVQDELRVPGKL